MTYIILLTRRVGVKVFNLFVRCNHGKSCGCYGTNLSYGYQIYWIQTFMILQTISVTVWGYICAQHSCCVCQKNKAANYVFVLSSLISTQNHSFLWRKYTNMKHNLHQHITLKSDEVNVRIIVNLHFDSMHNDRHKQKVKVILIWHVFWRYASP